ncbi:MAG: PaaI family thioesterase [Deltaproteobacteria bacterium]|nr:PaaI family thioesterase [Deltaproteobacteria bacterium]
MDLTQRFAAVPYHASLGLQVESVSAEGARLRVPYRDDNANPGQALHGGAIASTIDAAGALAAWAALGGAAGFEVGTLDLAVDYLAAAIGEDIIASAEVLRRGKELVYSLVDVRTDAGKRIAIGLSTYRGVDPAAAPQAGERQLVTPPPPALSATDMIKGARLFVTSPFMARLGIGVEMAHGGAARLAMPCTPDKRDADGAIHEGALAALIDSSGALSAWSVVGLDMRFKASTVGIHVSYHGRVPGAAVVAHARTLRRNNEIFLNQVTVVGRDSQVVVAVGEVTYRIVV